MNPDDIDQRIRERYGSLEQPNFHFVLKEMDKRPFESLIDRLGERFEIDENTDPNDDVSLSYELRRAGQEWSLQLSLIGPYAVLWRPIAQSSEVVAAQDEQRLRQPELHTLRARAGLVCGPGPPGPQSPDRATTLQRRP